LGEDTDVSRFRQEEEAEAAGLSCGSGAAGGVAASQIPAAYA